MTMDEMPELDRKVIVYELKDRYAEDYSGAPYLNISFKADTGKTTIMTYRFNGYSLKNSGERSYGGFIPKEYSSGYGKSAYMIVLGEDIGDYTLKAYTNGGCDTELEGAGGTIVRMRYWAGCIKSMQMNILVILRRNRMIQSTFLIPSRMNTISDFWQS